MASDSVGDRIVGRELDVTSRAQWNDVVSDAVGEFGTLNVLINNAGVLHRTPIEKETEQGFTKTWQVNCLGPFLGIQAALPHLREADNPSIVNTCSTGALRAFPNHAAYGSSKWALRGLTQTLAAEFTPWRIRVNAVFPGPIRTPMLSADTQARLAPSMAWGRLGEAAEVAAAVSFLASAEASFVTGAELTVDGGQVLQVG